MVTVLAPGADSPSLERLVESGMLVLESLHPGGLELTRELAQLCKIGRDTVVLDIASGTGESGCFLAEHFAARVVGIDRSDEMVRRATAKALTRKLHAQFLKAAAARLPFADSRFDAVICECTLCVLEKEAVVGEMVRVVRPGGHVGMHDLCWKEDAPARLKRSLAEIEGERPETLEAWQRLFEAGGLVDVKATDRSALLSPWIRDSRRQVGIGGQLTLALKIIRRWGLRGMWRVSQSERIFSSDYLGYGAVVGTKP